MTAISAATTQPTQSASYRPSYLDEIDPADEHYVGGPTIEGDLTFDDLIDLLNPLQHLPIVSTVYRAITGDQIQPHVRAIGSGLYGGPIGFLTAGAAMAIEEAVGTTPDKMLADLFEDGPGESGQAVATAPKTEPVTDAAQVAADQSTTNAKADALGAPTMFTIKNRPNLFALPDTADQRMSLAPRRSAEPPAVAQATAAETALAAQAAAAGTRPTTPPEASRTAQGLSTAQGNLLDRFVTGAKGTPRQDESMPALPSAPSPEWIATQMQANLQKYADAQRAGNAGS